jgi:histone acetyltransferase 1
MERSIYGYSQDLKINLKLAAGSLLTHVSVNYQDQIPASSTTKPDDVEGKMYEVLPADYLTNEETFWERVKAEESTFKPGTLHGALWSGLICSQWDGALVPMVAS